MLQVSGQTHPTCWSNITEMLVQHVGLVSGDLIEQLDWKH